MNSRMLQMLACPLCKQRTRYDERTQALLCFSDRLAFPVRDGLPVLLADEALPLDSHLLFAGSVNGAHADR